MRRIWRSPLLWLVAYLQQLVYYCTRRDKIGLVFFSNTLFSKNWHPTRCYITDKSPLSRLRWNDFNCLFDNTVRLKMARQWALEHSDFQSLKLKQFSMIKQFSIVFLQKKTMYIPYGLLFCTSARFSLPISRHMMTKTNIYIRISMNQCTSELI